MSEGLALWWPGLAEDASNARYSVLSQKAAAAHKGLFAPKACGIGPNEGHPIGLWAQWDADGNDRDDVNGEYVKIRNYDRSTTGCRSTGWYLRDSGLRRFTLPARLRHPAQQLGDRLRRRGRGRRHRLLLGPGRPGVRERQQGQPGRSATAPTCSTRRATSAPR